MSRTGRLLTVLLLIVSGRTAHAQIACGAGGALCTTTKYGLGLKPDYRKDEVPEAAFRYDDAYFGPDFGGVSFFVNRADLTGAIGNCGPRRRHSPLPGQIVLRELTSCAPTSEGPSCTAGTNLGRMCQLPTLNQSCTAAGAPLACCLGSGSGTCSGFQNSAANTLECGAGGVCTMDPGVGCRVEIPLSNAGIYSDPDTQPDPVLGPVETTSEALVAALLSNLPLPNGDTASINTLTGFNFGGTSEDDLTTSDGDLACVASAIRRKPSTGTRFILPANRGGNGTAAGGTYIRWDSARGIPDAELINYSTSLRLHSDDSGVCCAAGNPSLGTCTVLSGGVPTPNYPLLTVRDCSFPGRFPHNDNVEPDWIFEGGPRQTARFHTDGDFVLAGQIAGICRVNSSTPCFAPGANALCTGSRNPYSCCTGAGTGTCTENCSGLPVPPGSPADSCDFRSGGIRSQVLCARDSNNDPRPDCCATGLMVLRGVPNQGCSLLTRYPYSGDPGPDCGVSNFGINHRDDVDCNGVDDQIQAGSGDLCPFYTEWDQNLDSDGDCAGGPGGHCRGDECECGDQAGDGALSGTIDVANGKINVADIVGINNAIFGSVVRKRLCDANSDTLCNVSDIVGVNREIFVPDSSICRQITPRQCLAGVPNPCCGNGLREPPEVCDDGNLAPGDGCNAACRIEFGFTCTPASPSVCH